jgi:integrase
MAKTSNRGRKEGSRNRGFFYRKGRGWQTKTKDRRFVSLTDESGNPLKNKNTSLLAVREAYERFLKLANLESPKAPSNSPTVRELIDSYIVFAKREAEQGRGAWSTVEMREGILFDFCFGLPAKFLEKPHGGTAKDKLHDGYGKLRADEVTPWHVEEWLNAHPDWTERRIKMQAVRRVFGYAAKLRRIPANPLKGMTVPQVRQRIVSISAAQETALLENSNNAMKAALQVLIRTGMRPGEFCQVTAKHVHVRPEGLAIQFSKEETKTKRARTILVKAPEIVAIFKQAMKRHLSGGIFRSAKGSPWQVRQLSAEFRKARKKAQKKGMVFDDDCCLYSTRHCFAQRTLIGYYTGRPADIASLAKMMGNSVQICIKFYLDFSPQETDHLWALVG